MELVKPQSRLKTIIVGQHLVATTEPNTITAHADQPFPVGIEIRPPALELRTDKSVPFAYRSKP